MIIEERLQTPVTGQYDVLIAGGGVAGIAAALAAGRAGKRVVLIEKQFMLGGLATAGLVTIYLPLCDGYGRQVSFGLAEELLRLSVAVPAPGCGIKAVWETPQPRTEKDARFEADFNPHLFALLVEQALKKAGVTVLYGTTAVAAVRNGARITAVMLENKSGRFAVQVGSVVDATGDADIAHMVGAPCETFRQGNLLAAWYYFADRSGYHRCALGCCDIPDEEKNGKEVAALTPRRFGGLNGQELSEMAALSHETVLRDVQKRLAADPSVQPATIATIPQVRMTRRLSGAYTLDTAEMHTRFADSVGMVSDWRKRGPVYEVPFSTLYTPAVENLFAAGRCTSVTESMWDIMRVIPCCAVTGQAAGTAAALCAGGGTADNATLQTALRENGVVLHEDEL